MELNPSVVRRENNAKHLPPVLETDSFTTGDMPDDLP